VKAWRELSRLPRRLWILAAANLINRAGTMALPFLSLYLIKARGFSVGQAGAMLAVYGATALVVGPVSGALCDRWGANRVMTASLTVSGLSLLAFPLARGLSGVAGMTILWAMSGEAFRPAGMTVVSESAPPDMRKQANALNRLAINLGMSVGPAVGGFLAAVSFPALWVIDGATTLAAAAVLALFLTDGGPARSSESAGRPSLRALFDPRLRYALLAAIPVAVVFFQNDGALPVFLVRNLHLSEAFYGMMFTLNTLLIVFLEIPLNHATAGWSNRRTLTVGAALFAAGYGAHAFAFRGLHVALATIVWTFGEMIFIPGLTSYIAEISPEHRRGEYMGLYSMSFSVAFILGPWAGLMALDRFGPAALWTGALAIGVLSTFLFARLPVERVVLVMHSATVPGDS
jgi:predicted MFS family arabinose efflux permease